MTRLDPRYQCWRATSPAEVAAAQRLRYSVFVEELAASGALVDHRQRREADPFDDACDHILLVDAMAGGALAGTCRLMTEDGARRAGGFATEAEFDVGPLRRSGLRLMEVGRICIDRRHRGGTAPRGLLQGVVAAARAADVEVLFGLASLPGADPAAHRQALSWLHHDRLAPPALRPCSLDPRGARPLSSTAFDRRRAALGIPPLLKAYLRMGGRVGDGAFVDAAFGCTDVCVVLETAALGPAGPAPGPTLGPASDDPARD